MAAPEEITEMSRQLTVLVIGATGLQGGAVARQLLAKGHRVRALTRNADSSAARQLESLGAELAVGDTEDRESVTRAASGVDAVYAMTSFFESGLEAEVRQGRAIADAVKAADVEHFVYASVASADRSTAIPHFDSKYEIEKHIKLLGMPHTIVAPVYFSENLLSPWTLPGLVQGTLAIPVPPDRPVQQISLQDIASFVVLVLENPDRFMGKRIDIASDELTGKRAAEIVSRASGRRIDYVQVPIAQAYETSGDAARMFEWFDAVGYSADISALRREYPETGWRTFEDWAHAQDWGILSAEGATPAAAG
jgi:uncharacterized protein YbjT (DUF2867 family)